MNFKEFYESLEPKSDKGTLHNYIDGFYSKEFNNSKDESLKIIEIGIRRGESLNLLTKWFKNSTIFGIDNGIEMSNADREFVSKIKNAKIIYNNAYTTDVLLQFNDDSVDYIIDDGPHTLESQLYSIKHWFKKIKPGGKLIIEDIQSVSDLNLLILEANEVECDWEVFDLRNNKERYDDILLVLKKK